MQGEILEIARSHAEGNIEDAAILLGNRKSQTARAKGSILNRRRIALSRSSGFTGFIMTSK
jgi:hypothetical protein